MPYMQHQIKDLTAKLEKETKLKEAYQASHDLQQNENQSRRKECSITTKRIGDLTVNTLLVWEMEVQTIEQRGEVRSACIEARRLPTIFTIYQARRHTKLTP